MKPLWSSRQIGLLVIEFYAREYVVKNGTHVVGTISNFIGKDVVCAFEVNGNLVRYRRSAEYFKGLVVGEHYLVAYDPDDPLNAFTLSHKPVIPEAEAENFLTTSPISVKHESEYLDIEFKYIVENASYSRTQEPVPGETLDATQPCVVKYNRHNPKTAILFLDTIAHGL